METGSISGVFVVAWSGRVGRAEKNGVWGFKAPPHLLLPPPCEAIFRRGVGGG